MYALDSLRLEKGYRAWKSDLMLDQPVTTVGMDRLLRLEKPEFIGREAVTSNAGRNPKLTSVLLLVDAHTRCAALRDRPSRQGARRLRDFGRLWSSHRPFAGSGLCWDGAGETRHPT